MLMEFQMLRPVCPVARVTGERGEAGNSRINLDMTAKILVVGAGRIEWICESQHGC